MLAGAQIRGMTIHVMLGLDFRCVSHESKSHFIREEEKGQERKRDNNKGYQPPQVLLFTCSVTLATVFMGSVNMLCGWNGIKESYMYDQHE